MDSKQGCQPSFWALVPGRNLQRSRPMHHRFALAWAGVLGATGVVLGRPGRPRPEGPASTAAGTREVWETAVTLPACACRRPAGVCGMAAGSGRRPAAGLRPPGRCASGRRARSSSPGRSTPWPSAARAGSGPSRPLGGLALIAGWVLAACAALAPGAGPMPETAAFPPFPPTCAPCSRPCAASAARGWSAAACATGCSASRPKDFDIEVAGVDFEGLRRALSRPSARPTSSGAASASSRCAAPAAPSTTSACRGASRRPGAGHRGFAVEPDPALERRGRGRRGATSPSTRSRSIRSPARSIDPFGGRRDLQGPPPAPHQRRLHRGSAAGAARLPAGGPPRLHASPRRPPPSAARWPPPTPSSPSSASGASGRSGPSSRRGPRAASRSWRRRAGCGISRRSRRCAAPRRSPSGTPRATSSPTRGTASTPSSRSTTGSDGSRGRRRHALLRRPGPRLRQALDDRARRAPRAPCAG